MALQKVRREHANGCTCVSMDVHVYAAPHRLAPKTVAPQRLAKRRTGHPTNGTSTTSVYFSGGGGDGGGGDDDGDGDGERMPYEGLPSH